MSDDTTADTTPAPEELDAALARVAELEAEIVDLRADNENLEGRLEAESNVVDVSHLFLGDDRSILDDEERFPSSMWRDLATHKIKAFNRKERMAGGVALNPNDPQDLQLFIDEVKDEYWGTRLGIVKQGEWRRSLKLVAPYSTKDHIVIVGVPYEPQVNNIAGSKADGIVTYTNKGFKMPDPFICPAKPCFMAAAKGSDGRFLHDTYCSEEHRALIEGDRRPQAAPGQWSADALPFVGIGARG
ncbi:MAG: hypothetical protein DWQ40_00405 [Actinobacteria bacterium]|nr:MAG: hypothetical protein DWQ40_00405 [Actinomycetota bacterium]REK35569.1 MAG: hypothetical protein DWQ20_05980 [Actinomycetota bacterium]